MTTAPPQGFVARFAAAIDRILDAIEGTLPPSGQPLPRDLDINATMTAMAACLWLFRLSDKIARLVARVSCGALLPPRILARTPPGLGSLDRIPLPQGEGWLARLLPEPEPLAAALQEAMADPEFQPLLAMEPARFPRLLGPLCRAMGLAPPTAAAAPISEAPSATPLATAPEPAPARRISEAPSARRAEPGCLPAPVPISRKARLLAATSLGPELHPGFEFA